MEPSTDYTGENKTDPGISASPTIKDPLKETTLVGLHHRVQQLEAALEAQVKSHREDIEWVIAYVKKHTK